jgi:hypothetical protein
VITTIAEKFLTTALAAGLSAKAIVRIEIDGEEAREFARYDMGARIRSIIVKKIEITQITVWILFLIYDTASKYLAAFSGWNTGYAIQVAIIVVATAILPFYLTRFGARLWQNQFALLLLAPSCLAMLGYAGFFFVFIQPNFAEVTALQVIPRGLFPGLVITFILLMPEGFRFLQRAFGEATQPLR